MSNTFINFPRDMQSEMDSCNTAHDQPKAARFLSPKSNGRHGPQAHTREGARGVGREGTGGGMLSERAGSSPKGKSSQAEPGRTVVFMHSCRIDILFISLICLTDLRPLAMHL
jgi:hypothetical protein